MRFAHLADCHLGAWGSHPELRELPLHAFRTVVDRIISEKLDFVLIAGDFFDNSMPAVDVLRHAAEQLMRLKLAGVPVYVIAGSHDYSPTGKTMLSVLEAAGLLCNVHMKWAEDKSGARIFGVEGLRGGLDREYFNKLGTNSSASQSYDIFMFHSAVDELSGMKGVAISDLPKGFDYYASGHVHAPLQRALGEGTIVFPGPLFPAEFSELEELGCGSFCIVDVADGRTVVSTVQLQMAPVRTIAIKCEGKTPQEVESEFAGAIAERDVAGKIVLLKASGTLASGKATDVNWKRIAESAQQAGALAVKRSVHLAVKENEVAKIEASGSLGQIEQAIIAKNVEHATDRDVIVRLMDALSVEKGEDEKNAVYEEKVKSGVNKILQVV